jgi:hypothetical protein
VVSCGKCGNECLARYAKRGMYEDIAAPTLLYGRKVWATDAVERRLMGVIKMTYQSNVLEIITNYRRQQQA